jgi:hypothetical protein
LCRKNIALLLNACSIDTDDWNGWNGMGAISWCHYHKINQKDERDFGNRVSQKKSQGNQIKIDQPRNEVLSFRQSGRRLRRKVIR